MRVGATLTTTKNFQGKTQPRRQGVEGYKVSRHACGFITAAEPAR